MKMKQAILGCIAGALMLSGCTLLQVKVNVVGERTALENQVMGTYHALDREMLLLSSVRGIDPKGRIKTPPAESRDKKDVIAAMQVMDFYLDDIQVFKASGRVGENNRGLLEIFPTDRTGKTGATDGLPADARQYSAAEFNEIVQNVNQARQVVMQRVIDTNENLSRDDMPEIEKIFGKLNAENAKPGESFQTADDRWETR